MDIKKVELVKPYYLKYDGKAGFAQVVGNIQKQFIAIVVNSQGGGQVNRIMEVSKRKSFRDFGGACTALDFKATGFIVN